MKALVGCLLSILILTAAPRDLRAQNLFPGPESTPAEEDLLTGQLIRVPHPLFFCNTHDDIQELVSKPDEKSFIELRNRKYADGSCVAIPVDKFKMKKTVAPFVKSSVRFCEIEIEITLPGGDIKKGYTYRRIFSKNMASRCISMNI